jgi:hypothetical protein
MPHRGPDRKPRKPHSRARHRRPRRPTGSLISIAPWNLRLDEPLERCQATNVRRGSRYDRKHQARPSRSRDDLRKARHLAPTPDGSLIRISGQMVIRQLRVSRPNEPRDARNALVATVAWLRACASDALLRAILAGLSATVRRPVTPCRRRTSAGDFDDFGLYRGSGEPNAPTGARSRVPGRRQHDVPVLDDRQDAAGESVSEKSRTYGSHSHRSS